MRHAVAVVVFATALGLVPVMAHAAGQDASPPQNGGGSSGNGGPPPGRPGNSGGPREACKADAMSFCHGVQPGGGRIRECLEDHYKELSDSCYDALKKAPPSPPPPPNDGRPNGEPAPKD